MHFSHKNLWNSWYAAWVSDLLITKAHPTICISLTNLLKLHCLISRINQVVGVFIASYLIARPRGELFRYHVKRIHFTMQGFGFLSAISVKQIDNQLLLRVGKCRHHIISQDLIWMKIVVLNYLQTESLVILVIRLANFINCVSIEITIQLNS